MHKFTENLRAAGAWLLCAFVLLVALAFWPTLAAPFSAVKTAVLYVGAALALAAVLMTRSSLTLAGAPAWAKAGVAYVLAQAACGLMSRQDYLSGPALPPLVSALVIGVAVGWLAGGREQPVVATVAVAGIAVAMVALAQTLWRVDLFMPFELRMTGTGVMRITSTLGNPDFAATFLAGTAPALLIRAICSRKSAVRIVAATGLALSAAAVAMTGFRAGVLAFAVGLSIAATFLFGGRKRWVAGAAIAAAFVAMVVPASWHKRGMEEAWVGRTFIWRSSLPESARQWTIGAGPGTFAYNYPSRMSKLAASEPALQRFADRYERHAENDYVEALNESGLIGVALLVAFLALWFRAAWRKRGPEATVTAASAGGMASIATAALFDFPLHRPETLALLAVWVALPFAADLKEKLPSGVAVRVILAVVLVGAAAWAGVGLVRGSHELWMGQRAEGDHAYRTAADFYRQALRWRPEDPDAHFNLARCLAATGGYQAALQETDTAMRYVSEPELWVLRVRIRRAMGDYAGAEKELQEGRERFPYAPALDAEK